MIEWAKCFSRLLLSASFASQYWLTESVLFNFDIREESSGGKKLYPALSIEEIEDWMEHVPVFAVTDSNGAGVVLKPDDSTSGEHSFAFSIGGSFLALTTHFIRPSDCRQSFTSFSIRLPPTPPLPS